MIINLQRNRANRFIKFRIIIQTNNLPRVFFVIFRTKRHNLWIMAKIYRFNGYFFLLNFSLHQVIKCSNSCLEDCLRAFLNSFLKIRGSKLTLSKIIFAYSTGDIMGFFMRFEFSLKTIVFMLYGF